ncbi:hypothetical protein RFI_01153, partial [Reticulomyxa filosa]
DLDAVTLQQYQIKTWNYLSVFCNNWNNFIPQSFFVCFDVLKLENKLRKQSTKRQYLQGLYLVKNKQWAFHTKIELLEFEDLDVNDLIYIKTNYFSIHINQNK